MFTITLADLVGSSADVAKTKSVVILSFGATVNNPLELIEVPCVTAPLPAALELTFHVTTLLGSFVPVT